MDLEAIRKEKARRHLADFLTLDGRGFWRRAKHLDALCNALEAVERGEIERLMVFMPPRHGKSEVVSKKFPAWYLGRNPDNEVVIVSYQADLAYDFSKIARETLREWGPELWGVEIDPTSRSVSRWGIDGRRGGLKATGVGGPLTGRGGHMAIIDDPHKNWQEAVSKRIRDNIWDWYRSTFRTRLAPGGAIVIVMTRWHEDDLAGRLLRQGDEQGEWTVIEFPAYAGDNDSLGRSPGEVLWPERFDKEAIDAFRRDLGGYMFAALYQQKPRPDEGSLFKRSWFRYFREEDGVYVLVTGDGAKRVPKDSCWVFQTVDPAATESDRSDYFVAATWAVTKDRDLLLLDVFRERAETTKHIPIIRSLYERWRPSFQGVEKKTYGLNIIQAARREGLPIRPLPADVDKVSRARPVSARYEIGAVYHKQGAPWLDDWEAELVAFPHGAHDDQVDVAAYAGIEIAQGGTPAVAEVLERFLPKR